MLSQENPILDKKIFTFNQNKGLWLVNILYVRETTGRGEGKIGNFEPRRTKFREDLSQKGGGGEVDGTSGSLPPTRICIFVINMVPWIHWTIFCCPLQPPLFIHWLHSIHWKKQRAMGNRGIIFWYYIIFTGFLRIRNILKHFY